MFNLFAPAPPPGPLVSGAISTSLQLHNHNKQHQLPPSLAHQSVYKTASESHVNTLNFVAAKGLPFGWEQSAFQPIVNAVQPPPAHVTENALFFSQYNKILPSCLTQMVPTGGTQPALQTPILNLVSGLPIQRSNHAQRLYEEAVKDLKAYAAARQFNHQHNADSLEQQSSSSTHNFLAQHLLNSISNEYLCLGLQQAIAATAAAGACQQQSVLSTAISQLKHDSITVQPKITFTPPESDQSLSPKSVLSLTMEENISFNKEISKKSLVSPLRTALQPQQNDNSSSFPCDKCKKTYSTQSGLIKHKEYHCNGLAKQYTCQKCQKVYHSLSALKMHIRTHTLPCHCTICGKAFSRMWLLNGHIRTHTGEKPFQCDICQRSFADRSNLRAHMQTHSEVKRYKCETCTKTFSRMGLLTKHKQSNCSAFGHSMTFTEASPSSDRSCGSAAAIDIDNSSLDEILSDVDKSFH